METAGARIDARVAQPPDETPRGRSVVGFRWLWAGTAGGELGDGLLKTALPVIAAQLTDSPTMIAGVTFAATAPWVLLALPTGVVVDRGDRKVLMLSSCLGRLLALGLLAVALAAGGATLAALYLVAFALGTSEVLFETAAGAVLPLLVSRRRLEGANARLLATETVLNEFAGPPLAGWLVAVAYGAVVSVGAGSYAVATVSVAVMRGRFRVARATATSVAEDLSEGLRFVWGRPLLRGLAGMTAVMAGCWSAWQAVLVVFAMNGVVHLSSVQYGLLLSAVAAGGLLGAMLAVTAAQRLGPRLVIAIDVASTATMLGVPVVSSNAYVVGVATLIGGVGSGMWNVVVPSLIQRLTPDALLGRVRATSRLLGWGTMPIAALLAGLVAQTLDVRAVFATGCVLTLSLILPYRRLVRPTLMTLPRHPNSDAAQT